MSPLSLSDYPKEGTEAAFAVLSRIARVLADCTRESGGYCVIGGWVPFLLCSDHAGLGRHVGSMDVDILLVPGKIRLREPDGLGSELIKAGFEPEPGHVLRSRSNAASAKWWARNALPGMDIRIDFMAPADDRSRSLTETIAADLKMLRFYGTNAATHAPILPTPTGLSFPVANGGASLMAKTVAYEERRDDPARGKGSKDAYDLFYLVTSYREGVPRDDRRLGRGRDCAWCRPRCCERN